MRFNLIFLIYACATIIHAPEHTVSVSGLAGEMHTVQVPVELNGPDAYEFLHAEVAKKLKCTRRFVDLVGDVNGKPQKLTQQNYENVASHVRVIKTPFDGEDLMRLFRECHAQTPIILGRRQEYEDCHSASYKHYDPSETEESIFNHDHLLVGGYFVNILNIPEQYRLIVLMTIMLFIKDITPRQHEDCVTILDKWAQDHGEPSIQDKLRVFGSGYKYMGNVYDMKFRIRVNLSTYGFKAYSIKMFIGGKEIIDFRNPNSTLNALNLAYEIGQLITE